MKDKYKVHWTDTAQHDVRNIVYYIARDSVSRSKEILKELRQEGNNLKNEPERGRIVPELSDNNINLYREIIYKPWRIVYKIDEKKVFIISVLDGRRNLEDTLLRRILEH